MNDFAKRYFSVWFKMIAVLVSASTIVAVFGGIVIIAYSVFGPLGVVATIMLFATSGAALIITLTSDENDPI